MQMGALLVGSLGDRIAPEVDRGVVGEVALVGGERLDDREWQQDGQGESGGEPPEKQHERRDNGHERQIHPVLRDGLGDHGDEAR